MNAMQPGAFPAIVLNDVGPELAPAGLARIGAYVGGGMLLTNWKAATMVCEAVNGAAFPDFGVDQWQAWARRACRERPDGRVEFMYDPAIAQGYADLGDTPQADLWPLWQLLGATPVLTVRGALSDLLTADTLAEMENRHTGPFASITVPRRGHAPLLDEPEALAAIKAFLAGHLS
jgi:pimeloyl-ACP methyl ester carboxylesterase